MDKTARFVFLFAALAALLGMPFAETISCSFPYTYLTSTSRFISTDLNIAPTIAQPSQTLCTGTVFTPAIGVGSKWYASQYSTALKNRATAAACLYADTTVSTNNAILWTTASAMNAIDATSAGGRMFSDVAAYDSFASSNGVPSSSSFTAEKSQYGHNSPPPDLFTDGGGNTYYKADAGVYCAGTLRLRSVSSTNGFSYNQVIASDYLGTVPSGYNAPNVTAPGTVDFRVDLDLSKCIAAGRTYINTATCPSSQASVYLYARCENTAAHTSSSNTVSVTFENPFTCSIAAGDASVVPLSADPGTTFNVRFNITNSAIRPIAVDSIALSTESMQYFDAAGTVFTKPSGTIAANGGKGEATGIVKVKPTTPAGQYSLKLNVNYHSTQADCSNTNNIACNAPALVIITVTVGDLPTCTLAMSNHAIDMQLNDSALINATCMKSGVRISCPALNWSQNAAGTVTILPQQTAAGLAPFSNLSVGATALPQFGRQVTAVSNDPSVPLTCSPATFNINPRKPTGCSCALDNHTRNFSNNDRGVFNATCFDAQGALPCPELDWSHTATGNVSLNQTHTLGAVVPSVALSTGVNGIAQLNRQVSAVSTDPSVPLTCSPAPFDIIPYGGSAYIINCSFSGMVGNSTPAFFAGQVAGVQADCISGSGACPHLNWNTPLAGASMTPIYTPSGPSPLHSLLTLPTAEPGLLMRANVTVGCADPLQCNVTANCEYIFSPKPDNMTCGCLNHTTVFKANDSAMLQANCTKTGLSGFVACPALDWDTNISGADFNPNPTQPVIQPQTNFTTLNAPVPQSGYINAKSITSGIVLNCSSPILATVENIGPDYEVTWVKPPPFMVEPNQLFIVRVNITNVGNRNVTINTQTLLRGGNCSSSDQKLTTGGLNVGGSAIKEYNCVCPAAGTFTVTAIADSDHEITGELNLDNNHNYGTYICGINYAPVCFDYI